MNFLSNTLTVVIFPLNNGQNDGIATKSGRHRHGLLDVEEDVVVVGFHSFDDLESFNFYAA